MEYKKNLECKVYEDIINIELFNKIIAFIADTTTNKEKYNVLSNIREKCIWLYNENGKDFQKEYKFEYLGELLERYEERIGNNIKDIRAIALSLGYAKELLENSMFIGTQLVDFLLKIKNLAENDIYLQGALYLYDKENYDSLGYDIIEKAKDRTEELIFVLSVRNDDLEYIFNQKKENIRLLLGKNRTLSVIENARVYAWIIKKLYPLVNKTRTKNLSLLRTLVKISNRFQKEESTVYKELKQNGYTDIDIAYLNYALLYYTPTPDSLRMTCSITLEKIVIRLCKIFLNSKETLSDYFYNFIEELFSKYYRFDIRCYGKGGIGEALIDEINIINPITFIKFYNKFDERLYSFDILDEKWDVVAEQFDKEKYKKLFDFYIKTVDKTKINECIEKYNQLTKTNYIESFLIYNYRNGTFNFLVDNDIINLEKFFSEVLDRLTI